MSLASEIASKLRGWSLSRQLVLVFVTTAVVALAIVVGLLIGNAAVLEQTTSSAARTALEQQVVRNMNKTVADVRLEVGRAFSRAEHQVTSLSLACEDLFQSVCPLKAQEKVVFDLDLPVSQKSRNYSAFYVKGVFSRAELSELANKTGGMSANVDIYLQHLIAEDEIVETVYFAFLPSLGSVFRVFPAQRLPSDRLYSPHNTTWYATGSQSVRRGQVSYLPPRRGDFGNPPPWVVSLVRGMWDTHQNEVWGVTGLDLNVETLATSVLRIAILRSGYAALFQTGTGVIVAHPRWNREFSGPTQQVASIQTLESFSEDVWKEVLSPSEIGVTKAMDTKSGEIYLLAYGPFLSYVLLLKVPLKEALSSMYSVEQQLSTATTSVVISLSVIGSVTLVALVILVLGFAMRLSRRLVGVAEGAQAITRDEQGGGGGREGSRDQWHFGPEISSGVDEITDLSHALESMVTAIRKEKEQQAAERFTANKYHGTRDNLWASLYE